MVRDDLLLPLRALMCRHAAHTAAQRPKQMEEEEAAWAELGVERVRSQPSVVWERLSPYKNHT